LHLQTAPPTKSEHTLSIPQLQNLTSKSYDARHRPRRSSRPAQGKLAFPLTIDPFLLTSTDHPSSQGLLSVVGDPLGQVLDKTLKPTVGHVTGAVGKPTGEAAERVQNVTKNAYKWEGDKENVKDKDLPGGERIGGNRQTAQNPLCL